MRFVCVEISVIHLILIKIFPWRLLIVFLMLSFEKKSDHKGQWGIKTYLGALPSVSNEIPLRDSDGGDKTGKK